MKKIILGLSILAIAGATTFVACKKDEVKNESVPTTKTISANSRITGGPISTEEMEKILALSTDSLFQALVRIRIMEYNSTFLNANALQSLLSTEMTTAKIPEYSNLLGYPSTEDFIQTTNSCKQLEASLEEKYQFSSMRVDLITEAVALTGHPRIIPIPLALPAGKSPTCLTIYNNTCTAIVAESILMHIGCAAADLSVALGILCHSAVATWGISQTNIAKATYEACH